MAVKKVQILTPDSNYVDVVHPETEDTMVQITDANSHFTATKLDGVLDELFTNVSNGKIQVRDAITGKGGTVADADGDGIPTFTELANGVDSMAMVNGIIKSYTVASGETISAGDFVDYVNGLKVAKHVDNKSTDICTDTSASVDTALTGGGTYYACTAMDSQHVVLSCKQGLYLLTINGNSLSYSPLYQFHNTSYTIYQANVYALDSTRCLYIYGETGGSVYAVILDVSNGTITNNSTKTSLPGSATGTPFDDPIDMGNNLFICYTYGSGYTRYLTLLEIIDHTVTQKNFLSFNCSNGYAYVARLMKTSPTDFVVLTSNSSNNYLQYAFGSLDTVNKTLSCGTFSNLNGIATSDFDIIMVDDTRALLTYYQTSGTYHYFKLYTVNNTNKVLSELSSVLGTNSNANYTSFLKLGNNRFLLTSMNTSSTLSQIILLNNNTILLGPIYNFSSSSNASYVVTPALYDTDRIIVPYGASNDTLLHCSSIYFPDNHKLGVAKTSGTDGQPIDVYI